MDQSLMTTYQYLCIDILASDNYQPCFRNSPVILEFYSFSLIKNLKLNHRNIYQYSLIWPYKVILKDDLNESCFYEQIVSTMDNDLPVFYYFLPPGKLNFIHKKS